MPKRLWETPFHLLNNVFVFVKRIASESDGFLLSSRSVRSSTEPTLYEDTSVSTLHGKQFFESASTGSFVFASINFRKASFWSSAKSGITSGKLAQNFVLKSALIFLYPIKNVGIRYRDKGMIKLHSYSADFHPLSVTLQLFRQSTVVWPI